MFTDQDHSRMASALEEAKKAFDRDEVPIGAVLVNRLTGEIVSRQGNRTIELADPTAHAEILAIRDVCQQLDVQRLPDYDLYVTIEPCPMCAAALSYARLGTIYIGADDKKSGGISSHIALYAHPQIHHKPQVKFGLLAEEAAQLMRDFFAHKRKTSQE
jgi:tRNA(adenine34) deaminase